MNLIFQYLELRFQSKAVRCVGSFTFVIAQVNIFKHMVPADLKYPIDCLCSVVLLSTLEVL